MGSASATASREETDGGADVNVLDITALFAVDADLKVGDRVVSDGKIYFITGLQDDETDRVLTRATLQRNREDE